MNIVFVSNSAFYYSKRPFGRGGVDSQEFGLAKEIARRGNKVSIIGHFAKRDWKDEDVTTDKIHFINIKTPYLKDAILGDEISACLLSKCIAKQIKKIKPDVINLSGRSTARFPSQLNIPKVFVTHHPDAMDFYREFLLQNNILNRLRLPFIKELENNVMNRSDIIIALNNDIHNHLLEKGFTNIHVIPNGVDEKKYSNKSDGKFILFAGGLRKVKGINYLIEAFSMVAENHDTRLLIVGSGPDENNLKRIVNLNKMESRIHFIPMVNKIKLREEYLAKCSVFVLPSLFECLPVILLEAMACGKPVITSDNMGSRQVITHNHNGLIFERKNSKQLKRCLESLLLDVQLRERLGQNARRTVLEKFTFSKVVDEYLRVISQLVSK